MKKIINSFLALALMSTFACKDDDKDKQVNPVSTTETLKGNLATMTLDAGKKYLIEGQVFVNDGVVLTIPAGTVIMGDKATKGTLIINKGGKLNAEGTAAKPVVFTSELGPGERDKGDWGGIVILGRANVNQAAPQIEGISPSVIFGTNNSTANDAESSGTLKYVRVEYAGIALSPNNETNGITFGAVGSGTTVDYVQVSYGGDDAFEWFGGTVNAKHLVAFNTWDDDFDTDFGYSGKVQFALSIRDPFAADQSGSNAFESDNDASGSTNLPITKGVFSNVTVLGPIYDSSKAISGNYQHAVHIRRRSALSIFNSVISGFPTGFRIDGAESQAQFNGSADGGFIENNLMVVLRKGTAAADTVKAGTGNTTTDVYNVWKNGNNLPFKAFTVTKDNASLLAAGIDPNLYYGKNASYPADPNFGSLGTTGASAGGALFTNAKLTTGGFFSSTSYRGAFGGSDWTDGWAHFAPGTITY